MMQTLCRMAKHANFFISPLHHNKSILFKMKCNFSSQVNHPTIDKLIKSDQAGTLIDVFPEIGGLGEKNRELALKIVLSKVFSSKVAPSLLDNPKLLSHLAKHPEIMLQALLFRIKELMKSLNEPSQSSKKLQVFNIINDNFLQCFANLKKISGNAATKYQVMLHKRFADYNLLYLSKSVQPSEKHVILQKSRDFYMSTLIKMAALINEEHEKIKKTTNTAPQSPEKSEQQQLKSNAVKENIRMLIQTNSENIFHLFMVEKQLTKRGKEDNELPQNIIGLLPYFQKSLAYYQLFSKMTGYSIFYHRIKKLSLQIDYYSKINAFSKFNPSHEERKANEAKLWSALMEEFDKLYEEAIHDIKIIVKQPKHIGNIQELTLLLLNIRVHKSMRKEWKGQEYKNFLMQEVGAILDLINIPEEKKLITFHLSKVVKQMLDQKSKASK